MSKRILVVTGDGGEGYEALYAVHRFREAEMEPVVAAPSKRRLHLVMHDFEPGWDTYIERQGYGLEADIAISEAKAADYDAILIVGGRAPEYLRHDDKLVALTREFFEAGKCVFGICHGIQVLVAADVVRDRCVTCYEHVRNEVKMAGGTWGSEEAVRDGKIVTAQTWQSHPEFYREVFRCLAEI
jgi:protease I